MSKHWIQTWSGGQIFPLDAKPEQINITDIAWHLASQIRWKGATFSPFTVAQHSVMVSEVCDPNFALQGLLHDAPEAYLGDMPKPIKDMLPDFVRAENALWAVIAEKFGVPVKLHSSVKRADAVLLNTESLHLMWPPPEEWREGLPPPLPGGIGTVWSRDEAVMEFLRRFAEIT